MYSFPTLQKNQRKYTRNLTSIWVRPLFQRRGDYAYGATNALFQELTAPLMSFSFISFSHHYFYPLIATVRCFD